jgi:hypothetical protein
MTSKKKVTPVDIVRDFIVQFKDQPEIYNNNAKLARLVSQSQFSHLLNKDKENLRSTVRRAKGVAGKHKRKYISDKSLFEQNISRIHIHPSAKEYDSSDFTINASEVLILSDLQYPYFSNRALEMALEYAFHNHKIDAILINGDWFDFYQGSEYMRDPRNMRIGEELDGGCELIRIIQEMFGCHIYFKYGNHEERFDNYLLKKAGELKGIPEFELEACIKRRIPENITIIKDMRTVKIGKLNVYHGHEFRKGMISPVSPARGLWNRVHSNALQSDVHKKSEHTGKSDNETRTCVSIGCLCDLKPKWMPNNEWQHGFAIVKVDEDGIFEILNKTINIKKNRVY